MSINCSWMLSSTSLSTSRVSRIFLFESCSTSRARFDAISPQLARGLPRCGVPRKRINLVRWRQASDRRIACKPVSNLSRQIREQHSSYIFDKNAAQAVGYKYNRVLIPHQHCHSGSSHWVTSPHCQCRAQAGLQGHDRAPTHSSCRSPGIDHQ